MPIYEFECPVHGIFETILPLISSELKLIQCGWAVDRNNFCYEAATKVWSIPAGDLSIGKPTRIFINERTGEPFSPLKPYDKPPRGYREVELRNPSERSKFEKEQQRRIDVQNQLTSHILDSMKSEARKNRHDNLNAKMNAIQREKDPVTGETVEFTLDYKDKALVKKAMERSKKKKVKEKTSNAVIAINHYNSSNLDEIK